MLFLATLLFLGSCLHTAYEHKKKNLLSSRTACT